MKFMSAAQTVQLPEDPREKANSNIRNVVHNWDNCAGGSSKLLIESTSSIKHRLYSHLRAAMLSESTFCCGGFRDTYVCLWLAGSEGKRVLMLACQHQTSFTLHRPNCKLLSSAEERSSPIFYLRRSILRFETVSFRRRSPASCPNV